MTWNLSPLSYWGLWLAVFGRQLSLPVPAVLFLMTSGALAAHGQLHLRYILLAGVLGCLAGDGVWFWFGRRWGSRIVRLLCRITSDPNTCAKRARRVFDQWGLRILVVAKFVPGLDGVTPPLAGAEGSSVHSFLAFDSIGALLWSAGYTFLGFLFADQLDVGIRIAERFGMLLVAAVGIPLALYVCWRGITILRMVRHLRLHRMSAPMLAQKLNNGERVAVIDLRRFEGEDDNLKGIPGAVRMEPSRLRNSPSVRIPSDVALVLYCSSRNEFISARVAVALRRRGVDQVWVLDGGLASWQDHGLPLTTNLSTPEEVAHRLGIELPPEQESTKRKAG